MASSSHCMTSSLMSRSQLQPQPQPSAVSFIMSLPSPPFPLFHFGFQSCPGPRVPWYLVFKGLVARTERTTETGLNATKCNRTTSCSCGVLKIKRPEKDWFILTSFNQLQLVFWPNNNIGMFSHLIAFEHAQFYIFLLKTHEVTAVSYFNWPPLVLKRTCDLIFVTSTMIVVNVTPLHRSLSPALPTMTTMDAHRHLLLSKVSKTVKYSLTYWLITHPAPYRFWQCGSSCHIATAISTTLTTPSDVFLPPTTPRHVFRTPYTCLNPSATRFDHLQPSDTRLDPSATRFNHLQPPNMCFKH